MMESFKDQTRLCQVAEEMYFFTGVLGQSFYKAQTKIPFIVEISVVISDIHSVEHQTLFQITCYME